MDIKSIIAQSKQKKFLGEGDTAVRAFIGAKIEEMATSAIEKLIPSLFKEVSENIENEIERLTKEVKKGDKGDTPKVGVDFDQPKDGEPGKDYILTSKDKAEIASKIKVPIVEKITEKIEVQQPIITEVAKYETPDQIAVKLNTLEEKVDIKVIKGLEKWMKGIRENIREKKGGGGSGGGGMGNVVHQQFNGDGVTTSFTLSSEVAGGGNAVIGCRYEGQVQYLGDQFTISGRTLSMTFTPLEGTKIEITFIRT